MASMKLFSRREFGAIAAFGGASLCSWHSPQSNGMAPALSRLAIRGGVSLAGAEFGADKTTFSNINPGVYGRDYDYPDQRTVEYFAACGLGLLRIPFRWERLQPNLGQPLDYAELNRIRQVVAWAAGSGARIILDTHNYGRYQLSIAGRPRSVVIDEKVNGGIAVSRAHFADYWRRLAEAFLGNEAVLGLGLMNEPHDMGHSDWKAISQAAVEAVRTVDRESFVIVAGNGWSNAERFPELNGQSAWIKDPANRVLYEAHCYFDADGSGKYRRTYAEELSADQQLLERGAKRVTVFLDWCRRNRVTGFLGEFGIPGESAGWRAVLGRTLEVLQKTDTPACYWAAGEWWDDYPLSVQPRDDMRRAAPQLDVLRRWLASPRARS
jgi:endoglucanase